MTLSDSYQGFKVTGYLKVEYLADGARVFIVQSTCCRSLGALQKTCKNWGSSLKIFAKSVGRCFTPLIEIKHNSVSLRWNFCAYIQLIRGRFWLQLWTVKKFNEPRVSWKYLAKMWKNSKMRSQFNCCDASQMHGRTDGAYLGGWRCVGRVHSVVYNA